MKTPNHKILLKQGLSLTLLALSSSAYSKDSQNSGSDILQIVLGLLIVLAVIMALAWIVKKMTCIHAGGQSVARIVGAVSVGTRERVVVLEIANRWVVVGVAAGHVSAIANLDIEATTQTQPTSDLVQSGENFLTTLLTQLKLSNPSNRNKDA